MQVSDVNHFELLIDEKLGETSRAFALGLIVLSAV